MQDLARTIFSLRAALAIVRPSHENVGTIDTVFICICGKNIDYTQDSTVLFLPSKTGLRYDMEISCLYWLLDDGQETHTQVGNAIGNMKASTQSTKKDKSDDRRRSSTKEKAMRNRILLLAIAAFVVLVGTILDMAGF